VSKPKRGAPAKPASERASSWLQVRVATRRKAAWVKAAQSEGKKLSEWAGEKLDAAAEVTT